MPAKTTKKRTTKKSVQTKELDELKRFANALNATQHNPVDWAAIIAFAAPIVARITARYAARYIASKFNRKLTSKISTETANQAADWIVTTLQKAKFAK